MDLNVATTSASKSSRMADSAGSSRPVRRNRSCREERRRPDQLAVGHYAPWIVGACFDEAPLDGEIADTRFENDRRLPRANIAGAIQMEGPTADIDQRPGGG